MTARIRNLGCIWGELASRPDCFTPVKEPSVSFGWEAVWALEPNWNSSSNCWCTPSNTALILIEILLVSSEIKDADRPTGLPSYAFSSCIPCKQRI